jgi:hypothetical protein
MNRITRIFALILLFFNGISALGGGIVLITDPSGESVEMPLSLLEHSPFKDFLIPGIILFTMNGVLSILFAIPVILKSRISGWLVLLQGCILTGWLAVQLVMIRDYDPLLHTLYLGAGAMLIITGILLIADKTKADAGPNTGQKKN